MFQFRYKYFLECSVEYTNNFTLIRECKATQNNISAAYVPAYIRKSTERNEIRQVEFNIT